MAFMLLVHLLAHGRALESEDHTDWLVRHCFAGWGDPFQGCCKCFACHCSGRLQIACVALGIYRLNERCDAMPVCRRGTRLARRARWCWRPRCCTLCAWPRARCSRRRKPSSSPGRHQLQQGPPKPEP
jgi:hypothetical protein